MQRPALGGAGEPVRATRPPKAPPPVQLRATVTKGGALRPASPVAPEFREPCGGHVTSGATPRRPG